MIHILLAAYNEEQGLGDVLKGLVHSLPVGQTCVWVVDDGSTDNTARVACQGHGPIPLELIQHKINQGLGAALNTGFSALLLRLQKDDVVVTLDADNTHPTEQIPTLIFPIEAGRADLTIASRFVLGARVAGVPFYRRILSVGASLLFRWMVPVSGVRDYTCGFRAYRGDLLLRASDRWKRLVTENGFAAAAEILVKVGALCPRVEEIPLDLRYDRKPGASKMRVVRTILRNLAVMGRLRNLRE